ncbi:MAG TPA: TetR/AcrR family transcriptional regulator [Caldithrix abyssi]|uniref:TetR/AcrR family transcriptional regulator n=1 Tax=Caldithrix abyssi TaxID=187145 RepID=A0A7V1LP35_CALAY|nr:TetR/AcrR family transcriptional regulator [Caldithrix abyssi]
MAPKIVDRQAKRERIVGAAITVFAQKGVANTKMIDIARAAGIGKGTLYEYFRNKEDIFASAYDTMNREMEQQIAAILSAEAHPARQLQMIFDYSLDYFSREAVEFSSVMMDFWAEGIRRKNPEMMGVINLKEIYDRYRVIIAGIVRKGQEQGLFIDVDAVSYASLAIGALDGLLLQLVMSPELIDITRMKATFKQTMIQCLEK